MPISQMTQVEQSKSSQIPLNKINSLDQFRTSLLNEIREKLFDFKLEIINQENWNNIMMTIQSIFRRYMYENLIDREMSVLLVQNLSDFILEFEGPLFTEGFFYLHIRNHELFINLCIH